MERKICTQCDIENFFEDFHKNIQNVTIVTVIED